MSTEAHTPGPFVVMPREPDIGGFTIEIDGEVELPVAIVPRNRRPRDETLANAKLFAAAPSLLAEGIAALQELRRLRDILANAGRIDEPLSINVRVKALKAALSKATDADLSRSAIAKAEAQS